MDKDWYSVSEIADKKNKTRQAVLSFIKRHLKELKVQKLQGKTAGYLVHKSELYRFD